jgi:hypothetical protein
MSVRTLEGDLPGGYGVYVEHAVYQGDWWWPPLGDRTTDEPGYGDRLVSRYADRGVSTTHRGFGGEVTMFTIAFWQATGERGDVAPLGRSSQSGYRSDLKVASDFRLMVYAARRGGGKP